MPSGAGHERARYSFKRRSSCFVQPRGGLGLGRGGAEGHCGQGRERPPGWGGAREALIAGSGLRERALLVPPPPPLRFPWIAEPRPGSATCRPAPLSAGRCAQLGRQSTAPGFPRSVPGVSAGEPERAALRQLWGSCPATGSRSRSPSRGWPPVRLLPGCAPCGCAAPVLALPRRRRLAPEAGCGLATAGRRSWGCCCWSPRRARRAAALGWDGAARAGAWRASAAAGGRMDPTGPATATRRVRTLWTAATTTGGSAQVRLRVGREKRGCPRGVARAGAGRQAAIRGERSRREWDGLYHFQLQVGRNS